MKNTPIEVARPFSFGSVVEALLDTPVIGPYPVLARSRGDGTVVVGDRSIIRPIRFTEDVPQGRLVVLSKDF